MKRFRRFRLLFLLPLILVGGWSMDPGADAQIPMKDHDTIFKGMEKVISSSDGKPTLFSLWIDKKQGRLYGEFPKDFERKKYFIAMTIASGELFAGLQSGDLYAIWRKYNNRLALIEPNLDTRSTGDDESKSSVERLFTGRVIADVPILAETPTRSLVIDLADLLLGHSPKFFGFGSAFGGGIDPRHMKLREIKTAKVFPHNVEIAFETPFGNNGQLKTLHFSISDMPDNTGYRPRKADDRVGYFTTAFDDLGKFKKDETRTRYINRWHLEKADPSLKFSPPKQPIIFYVEHTTPIRYRRFVRDGVIYWNKAFEKVGLVNAIEVYYQDAPTGAHMEKDPEDVRYNFLRWLSNNQSTAIGPSRVHPLTGQILDADIILTDGWIRHFERQFGEMLPSWQWKAWGQKRWPGSNASRNGIRASCSCPPISATNSWPSWPSDGAQPLGGHPAGVTPGRMLGQNEFDGIKGRVSQVNGLCLAAQGRAFDMALLQLSKDLLIDAENKKGSGAEPKPDDDELDGVPARFIGPLLADLVAHEVGHTLGLRHNFKASGLYSLAEINSNKIKGQKPFAGSVMDYLPVNINLKAGEVQGDYAMIDVGPYDMWAIEYGYTFEKDLKPILARCVLPENQYGTDQDTWGPDPLARRYDFSSAPIDYAKNQMHLAKHHRARLLNKFVEDGESWNRARHGYELTLGLQIRSLSMMANWIGGTFVHRDHKGDKGNRPPIEAVPAAVQCNACSNGSWKTLSRMNPTGSAPPCCNGSRTIPWMPMRGAVMTIPRSRSTTASSACKARF